MADYEIKRRRPAVARETGAVHGAPDAPADSRALAFKVTVADRGRIVLPVEVRERLKIQEGDWLTMVLEADGVIKMLTGRVWTDEFLKVMRHAARHIPPGRKLSDELIAERRREAAGEEREFRRIEAVARTRKRR